MTSYIERCHNADLLGQISEDVHKIVQKYLSEDLYGTLSITQKQVEKIESEILSIAHDDLIAFSEKDPAAHGFYEYVLETHSTFKALMHYRVANRIYNYNDIDSKIRSWLAMQISDYIKVEFSIDIHPGAKIGKRFVIDHGFNTVIGETCEIGSDCYMLNNIILGVKKFGTSESEDIIETNTGKRHPTLGNNVRVAAFTRILGPITIGDDVIISPHSVITHNIPAGSKVVIVNQLQICRGNCDYREIYGIVPENDGVICVYGKELQDSSVSIVEILDDDIYEIENIKIKMIENNNNKLKFKILIQKLNTNIINKYDNLTIIFKKNEKEIILTDSLGLKRTLEDVMRN